MALRPPEDAVGRKNLRLLQQCVMLALGCHSDRVCDEIALLVDTLHGRLLQHGRRRPRETQRVLTQAVAVLRATGSATRKTAQLRTLRRTLGD